MSRQEFQSTKKEGIAYTLYFFGQNVFYLFITLFIQVYFTDIGITAATVGIIFLIARVWDAINDPLFGIIVDCSRLKSGRFLPWIRFATFLIPVFSLLLFLVPSSLPILAKSLIAGGLYILWGMSYTICDVPIFALSTAMTGNIQERTTLISRGRIAAVCGLFLVNIGAPMLLPILGWFPLALVFSILGCIFMMPISFTAKERLINDAKPITLKEILGYLTGNKYLLIFYGAMIVASITNMTQTMGLYFARINLGDGALFTPIMVSSMVPMLLVAFIIPLLTKKFDKIYLYMFGLAISVIFSVLSYFVGYQNFIPFIILSAIKGLGQGFTMVMMFMFSADCVEYGTYKTGTRAEGITFSIQTFATKMFGALSGALGMLLLAMFGFLEGANVVQPDSAVDGIWFMYSLLPAFGNIVAFFILLFLYKLKDKDVQIMADVNQGTLSRKDAEKQLSRNY